jgi:hypothetical protein
MKHEVDSEVRMARQGIGHRTRPEHLPRTPSSKHDFLGAGPRCMTCPIERNGR